MFTGIVEKTLKVIGVANGPMFHRVTVAHDWRDVQPGESIAINGVCLTVAELTSFEIGFDVIQETLAKTNLGMLSRGDEVNAERSLRVGERIDGHFVQGHVDGVGRLAKDLSSETERRLTIEAPLHLAKYLVPKGSICIDGVSLTIAAVEGQHFDVALIPTTLKLTNIGKREIGWAFNLEADILSKQIVHHLEQREKM